MKRIALIAAFLVGVYLTGRAIAEPFVIHWGDPASYRSDWGGPTLALHARSAVWYFGRF